MQIEFEPKTTGKKGQPIASRYTADGSFPKRGVSMPVLKTVGMLKEFLAQLPDKLPIEFFSGGVQPHWYNVGDADEHLTLEDPDEDELE